MGGRRSEVRATFRPVASVGLAAGGAASGPMRISAPWQSRRERRSHSETTPGRRTAEDGNAPPLRASRMCGIVCMAQGSHPLGPGCVPRSGQFRRRRSSCAPRVRRPPSWVSTRCTRHRKGQRNEGNDLRGRHWPRRALRERRAGGPHDVGRRPTPPPAAPTPAAVAPIQRSVRGQASRAGRGTDGFRPAREISRGLVRCHGTLVVGRRSGT
jgi:hypothetical protein